MIGQQGSALKFTAQRSTIFFILLVFPPLLPAQAILVPLLEVRGEFGSIPVHWGEVLGQAMLGLGDVNGDSIPDYAVSGSMRNPVNSQIKIYLGGKGELRDTVYRTLPGGTGLAKGDLNGDGFVDLIAYLANYTGKGYDTLYVYLGKEPNPFPFDTIPSLSIVDTILTGVGRELCIADVNGDGKDDIIAGVWSSRQKNPSYGFYVYFGRDSLHTAPDIWVHQPGRPTGIYPEYIRTGDLNGDGCADIILSWRKTHPKPDTSFITIFYGHPGFNPSYSKPDLEVSYMKWKWSAPFDVGPPPATAFDINADGFDDLMAWTPNWDFPEVKRGRVYYFFGSPSGVNLDKPDYVLEFPRLNEPRSKIGTMIHPIGDVNMDGFEDMLIDGTSLGTFPTVFVYLGGPKLSPYASAMRTKADGTYGNVAAALGDVNDDGINDFGVTATRTSPFPNEEEGYFAVFSGNKNLVLHEPKLPVGTPSAVSMLDPYPQPFEDEVFIPLATNRPAAVTVTIRNVLGAVVYRLDRNLDLPGRYLLSWKPNSGLVPPGMYMLSMWDGVILKTKKLIKLR